MKQYAVIGTTSEKVYMFNQSERIIFLVHGQGGALHVFDDKILAHHFSKDK